MDEKKRTKYYSVPVIGIVHSPYKQKFGIPRQAGLAPAGLAQLEILEPYADPEAFLGLDECSHVWLQFIFHHSLATAWRPRVRPPRLGGNKSLGVFATRSPVRPSALGLSAVKLEKIVLQPTIRLYLRGLDLVDGTPVVDIKPYVPYADCIADAQNNFADKAPTLCDVVFSETADQQLAAHQNNHELRELICQVLQQDPRPAFHAFDPDRVYGMQLADMDVRWCYKKNAANEKEFINVLFIADDNINT